jgi:Type IV secretory pathway, VirD4 components
MNAARNSYVILDPKGEILRDTGHLLEKKGYEVRVLDLISMEKSHCYNPFVYLQNDNDVQKARNQSIQEYHSERFTEQ